MCDCFLFIGSTKPSDNDRQNPLLTTTTAAVAGDDLHNPTAAMTLIIKSWLNGHWVRYLILLMCSPLLIPIVCIISPFICVAEVCFCLFRRRRSKVEAAPVVPTTVPRQQEEGRGNGNGNGNVKVSLLDRYLDDQLELALEILDECGGDLGFRYDCIDDNNNRTNNSLC